MSDPFDETDHAPAFGPEDELQPEPGFWDRVKYHWNKANSAIDQTALNTPVVGPIYGRLNDWSNKTFGGTAPTDPAKLQTQMTEAEKNFQASRGADANSFDWASLVGAAPINVGLGLASMTPAGRIGKALAASSLGKLGVNAIGGATGGAIGSIANPVLDSDNTTPKSFWEDKAGQAASGAIGGAIAQPALGGLSAAVAPTVRPAQKLLMDNGVTLPISSTLGTVGANMKAYSGMVPIASGIVHASDAAGMGQVNRAVIEDALGEAAPALRQAGLAAPGGKFSTAPIGGDAIAEMQSKLSDAYTHVLSSAQLRPTPQLFQDLVQAEADGAAKIGDPSKIAQFRGYLNNKLYSVLSPQGLAPGQPPPPLTGQTLQDLLSSMKYDANRYGSAPSGFEQDYGTALKGVIGTLQDHLGKQDPQTKVLLDGLNKAWAKAAIINDAGAKAAVSSRSIAGVPGAGLGGDAAAQAQAQAASHLAPDALMTPAQLLAAAKASARGSPNVANNTIASGQGLGQEIPLAAAQEMGHATGHGTNLGHIATAAAVGDMLLHGGGAMEHLPYLAGLAGMAAPGALLSMAGPKWLTQQAALRRPPGAGFVRNYLTDPLVPAAAIGTSQSMTAQNPQMPYGMVVP